jgi:hypothetical protein
VTKTKARRITNNNIPIDRGKVRFVYRLPNQTHEIYGEWVPLENAFIAGIVPNDDLHRHVVRVEFEYKDNVTE